MHLAASYVCRRAKEVFGEEGREEGATICSGASCSQRKRLGTRGPICSILRIREEYSKKLLEEGASALERRLIERGIL
jgi:hypothetical protein